jgi:hypothetical protein
MSCKGGIESFMKDVYRVLRLISYSMFGVMNTNPDNPNNLLRYEWSLMEFGSIFLIGRVSV